MTVDTAHYARQGYYLERPAPTGLAEVVDLILDKGLVIDVFVRVALVGIEILTIDARIVVASVNTYLRFAEAVNRLDLASTEPRQLPEFLGAMKEQGSRKVAKGVASGAVQGGKERISRALHGDNEEEEAGNGKAPRPRPRARRAD